VVHLKSQPVFTKAGYLGRKKIGKEDEEKGHLEVGIVTLS